MWYGSIQQIKGDFRDEFLRSAVALLVAPIVLLLLGWAMDNFILTDIGDKKLTPVVYAVLGLMIVGAASVFFSLGFEYSNTGKLLGGIALAVSMFEFIIVYIQSPSTYREILNIQTALTFTAAVAILSSVTSRKLEHQIPTAQATET